MAGYQCRLRTNSAIRMLTPNGNSWRKRATGWDRARSKYGRLYEMADLGRESDAGVHGNP